MTDKPSKLLMEIESKSLDEVLCSWNLGRLIIVFILTIVFQIANLLNKTLYYNEKFIYAVLLLICICLIALVFVTGIYFSPNVSTRFKKHFYFFFWMIYPALLTPFYIKNIIYNELPFNLFIIISIISAFPIINIKETVLIYIAPISINIMLIIIYPVSFTYIIYVCACLIAGFIVSINVHGKYMNLLFELSRSCTYDSLTGILNKNAGYQRCVNMFEICKRLQQPFCIYMLDVDFFKTYNDTYGHPAGDKVLKNISHCISNTFARKQDIISRYGGEEFIICCYSKDINDFSLMAETLLDNIYDLRIEAGNKSVAPYITASIGYTIYVPTEKNVNSNVSLNFLIKQADQALYKAKALGRNQYFKL